MRTAALITWLAAPPAASYYGSYADDGSTTGYLGPSSFTPTWGDGNATCFNKTWSGNENAPYQQCGFPVRGITRSVASDIPGEMQMCWFDIMVPSALDGVTGRAAAIHFHGGGSAATFDTDGRPSGWGWWGDYWEYELNGRYVYVSAHSSLTQDETTGEVTGSSHAWGWKEGNQRTDYRFIEMLMQWLSTHRNVDSRLIFGTGHSSGGNFLYQWAAGGPRWGATVDADPELWRAISPRAANLSPLHMELRPPAAGYTGSAARGNLTKTAILILHGQDDGFQQYQPNLDDGCAVEKSAVNGYFGWDGTRWADWEQDTTFGQGCGWGGGKYFYPVYDASLTAQSSVRPASPARRAQPAVARVLPTPARPRRGAPDPHVGARRRLQRRRRAYDRPRGRLRDLRLVLRLRRPRRGAHLSWRWALAQVPLVPVNQDPLLLRSSLRQQVLRRVRAGPARMPCSRAGHDR